MLTPALPRCARHKHIFECFLLQLQSGALVRFEWNVPRLRSPQHHFHPSNHSIFLLSRILTPALQRTYSRMHCTATHILPCSRSHLPAHILRPALMHADACTAPSSVRKTHSNTRLVRSHLPSRIHTPALMHADASTASSTAPSSVRKTHSNPRFLAHTCHHACSRLP